jgi:hypothetical protein
MVRVRPLDCWADKDLSDRTTRFPCLFNWLDQFWFLHLIRPRRSLLDPVRRRCTGRAVAVPHCCTYRGIRPATTSTASIALALQATRNGCPSEKQGSAALYLCLGRQSSDRSFGDHRVRELAYGGATPRCIFRREEEREFVPRPNPSPLNELADRPSAAADFCNKSAKDGRQPYCMSTPRPSTFADFTQKRQRSSRSAKTPPLYRSRTPRSRRAD